MQNNPEEVKSHLMWMVGRPPQVTQEWILQVLQQFMTEKELSMEDIKSLIPVVTDQEVIEGSKMPEDPLAQEFLDSLIDHLKIMKASGGYEVG